MYGLGISAPAGRGKVVGLPSGGTPVMVRAVRPGGKDGRADGFHPRLCTVRDQFEAAYVQKHTAKVLGFERIGQGLQRPEFLQKLFRPPVSGR